MWLSSTLETHNVPGAEELVGNMASTERGGHTPVRSLLCSLLNSPEVGVAIGTEAATDIVAEGGVARQVNGLRLHLSSKTETGYEGVYKTTSAHGVVRFKAQAGVSQSKKYVGSYATAVEAAVAFAQFKAQQKESRVAQQAANQAVQQAVQAVAQAPMQAAPIVVAQALQKDAAGLARLVDCGSEDRHVAGPFAVVAEAAEPEAAAETAEPEAEAEAADVEADVAEESEVESTEMVACVTAVAPATAAADAPMAEAPQADVTNDDDEMQAQLTEAEAQHTEAVAQLAKVRACMAHRAAARAQATAEAAAASTAAKAKQAEQAAKATAEAFEAAATEAEAAAQAAKEAKAATAMAHSVAEAAQAHADLIKRPRLQ